MSEFTLAFDKAIRETEEDVEKVFRGTAFAMFSKIISLTPLDTGRLRGNWQTTLNKPAKSEVVDGNPTSEALSVTKQANIKDAVFMANNLPYAGVIEEGSSTQAPQGMVKITVDKFTQELEKQARKVK